MIYNWPVTKEKGETWVINAGNDGSTVSNLSKTTIKFKSNDKEFSSIEFLGGIKGTITYGDTAVGIIEIDPDLGLRFKFYNEAYRTVTFLEPPTGKLLTWLQANATKKQ